jgi:putative flavoprotein involved in K+ transport
LDVVVVGGNSGFQIAEELAASRPVDLSIATTYPMLPSGWPVGTCSGG